MSTWITLFIFLLGLLVVAFVISPFLSKQLQETGAAEVTDWEEKKEQIFSQLSDLEYDYQMGKLSADDYHKTKAELTARAAQFTELQQKDLQSLAQEVDAEIERYLAKQKRALSEGGLS